jgi:hypothetical protein
MFVIGVLMQTVCASVPVAELSAIVHALPQSGALIAIE